MERNNENDEGKKKVMDIPLNRYKQSVKEKRSKQEKLNQIGIDFVDLCCQKSRDKIFGKGSWERLIKRKKP